MRKALSAAPAALLLALSACSYSAETVGVTAQVDNIPAQANTLIVTVTDALGASKLYYPSFGPGTYGSLQLSFAPPAPGVFTITVQAQDAAKDDLADGTVSGNYSGTETGVEVALAITSLPGTYGAPCVQGVSGNPNTCAANLTCLEYRAGDLGVCTQTCTSSCPAAPSGGTCVPFGSPPVSYCQFDCTPAPGSTTNGPCPQGLICRASTGGKSYCEGS